MELLILAAGMGKRIGLDVPKCLVRVNGKSILEHQVSVFRKYVDKITVVSGYKHSMIEEKAKELGINTLFNPFYFFTENVLSLFAYLSYNRPEEPLLIISGDIIIKESVIKKLIGVKGNILVSENWEYDHNKKDAMKIYLENSKVKKLGKNINNPNGEFITLCKIEDVELLWNIIKDLIINKKFFNEYVAYVYNQMIENNINFDILFIDGNEWLEIDTIKDLDYAKKVLL